MGAGAESISGEIAVMTKNTELCRKVVSPDPSVKHMGTICRQRSPMASSATIDMINRKKHQPNFATALTFSAVMTQYLLSKFFASSSCLYCASGNVIGFCHGISTRATIRHIANFTGFHFKFIKVYQRFCLSTSAASSKAGCNWDLKDRSAAVTTGSLCLPQATTWSAIGVVACFPTSSKVSNWLDGFTTRAPFTIRRYAYRAIRFSWHILSISNRMTVSQGL